MSRGGPNIDRRKDLETAIKKAKDDDWLDLQTLASVWGTSKATFVNTLRQVERLLDVPQYREVERGIHLYPAKAMLNVMLAYEQRNDAAARDKQDRRARILGQHRAEPDANLSLPVNELATLSRIAIETESRERAQGLYIHRDEVARVVGGVFGSLSAYLSQLEAHIDPNGVLPREVRATLREGGTRLSLQMHGDLKDMLSPNADLQPSKRSTGRSANGRPRRAPTRRKR